MAARDGDILQNHSRPRPCATPTTRSRKRALGCGKAEDRESRTSHFYPPDLTFAWPIPILSLLRRGLRLRGWKQSWSAGMRLIFMLTRARRLMWISLYARPTPNVGSFFKQRIPLIRGRRVVKIVSLTAGLPVLKNGDYEEQCNPRHCWSRRRYYWGRSRLFGFRSWQAASGCRGRKVYPNVRRSQWQHPGDSRFDRFPERPGQPGPKLEYASGNSQRRGKPDTSSHSFTLAGVSWNSAHSQGSGNSAGTKQRPVHHARDTESRVKQPNSGEKCIGCFKPGCQPVAAVIGESASKG